MKKSKREKIELPKRLDYNEDLEGLYQHSKHNKTEILANAESGCFYCGGIFPSNAITEWCDRGKTAICFICGIDSVIANEGGLLTTELLSVIHQYWFEGCAYAIKMEGGEVVDIIDEDGLYDPDEFAVFRLRTLENISKKTT